MNLRGVMAIALVAVSAAAQVDLASVVKRLSVRVEFTGGGCERSSLVRLVSEAGNTFEASLSDQCSAGFSNIPEGTYHLRISGSGFNSVDDAVRVSNASPEFGVRVARTGEPQGVSAGDHSVAATALAIPSNAHKKFDKAQKLIDQGEFAKAIDTLNEAIAIYPRYTNAYNNLGVAYARLGDSGKERDALQKAIGIDDHFAPAYLNLGVMDVKAGKFAPAETELDKATAYDPSNGMALVLLAYSQFMNHHFDEAIATSRRAHDAKGAHAFAHQVAAHSYEQKRDAGTAMEELELFLKEEPAGERADAARKELSQLQHLVQRDVVRGQ